MDSLQAVMGAITKARSFLERLNSMDACKEQKLEILRETKELILQARVMMVNKLREDVFKRYACEELTDHMAFVCGVADLNYDEFSIKQTKQVILATVEIEEALLSEINNLGEKK